MSVPIDSDKPYRFIVADDEPMLRMLLDAYLRSIYQAPVEKFEDGAPALTYIQQYCAQDERLVLMTDLNMNHVHGAELIRRARAHLPDLPVVLMSGTFSHDLTDTLIQEFAAIDVALLPKPFERGSLVDAITKACEHKK